MDAWGGSWGGAWANSWRASTVPIGVSYHPGGYNPQIEKLWDDLREKEEAKARKPEPVSVDAPASQPEPAKPRKRVKPKFVPQIVDEIQIPPPLDISKEIAAVEAAIREDEDEIELLLMALA